MVRASGRVGEHCAYNENDFVVVGWLGGWESA